ncbi:Oidioi.mRNA.OKI2018_I69.chrUn_7.g17244.t1.cds [Oikopleura dioica]|uniref:Oidioi.mRNA.OKI2018_I69.PAR.g10052.t1.cds n=1 Tax=Oikopleura dioica TaxID=34765 RepID=A0ABN7T9D0_OIKDI|nr:Oidioi.mRNA.OKI2018_I69.PAR.g10052.t1.cds [Oikopleura dioica]CAG5114429.1 Oidioi.mRNA.OKI2018_I69.chrUn_7.g17244.t1.cds [Oikopleura dioica]
MKLFGLFAGLAAAQDFRVLNGAAEDLDKIIRSSSGNFKEIFEKVANYDFERPRECHSEKMTIEEGVACVQQGFSQILEFASETFAETSENLVKDGAYDRVVERASALTEQMKKSLEEAGFNLEKDLENRDENITEKDVEEYFENFQKIMKEAFPSFGKRN